MTTQNTQDPGSTVFDHLQQEVPTLAQRMNAKIVQEMRERDIENGTLRDEDAVKMSTQQLAEVLGSDEYDLAGKSAAREVLKLRIKHQAQDKLSAGLEYYQRHGAPTELMFMIMDELDLRAKAAAFQKNKLLYKNNSAIMEGCADNSVFKVQFRYKAKQGYEHGFQGRPSFSRDTADDRANTATPEQRAELYKSIKRYGPQVFQGFNGFDYAMRKLKEIMEKEKRGENNMAEYVIYWNQELVETMCYDGVRLLPMRLVYWSDQQNGYTTGPYDKELKRQ